MSYEMSLCFGSTQSEPARVTNQEADRSIFERLYIPNPSLSEYSSSLGESLFRTRALKSALSVYTSLPNSTKVYECQE